MSDDTKYPTPDTRGFTNKGSLQKLAKSGVTPQEMNGMAYRAAKKDIALAMSQTEPPQSDQLTLSLEVFPARISLTQAKAPASKASVQDYGQSSPVLLARYDPDGPCWRTSQRCLVEGWTVLRETWPRSGMTVNGTAYQLPPLVPLTGGTGYGLLPTPAGPSGPMPELSHEPKPNQRCYSKKTGKHCQVTLDRYVQMWPTPTSRDWKDGSAEACKNVPVNGLLGRTVHQNQDATGTLNPTWVEWLQGYPLGWTEVD